MRAFARARRARAVAATAAAAAVLTPLAVAPADPGHDDCDGPIKPAPVMPVLECDGMDRIVEKASRIVPRPEQVAWQRHEITAFTHFGMNTFTDREWGSGMEDEATFDPPRIDVEQWMRTYRAMGAKLVMLTAKHHDGFVLYPTRYSPHSVIASPWWVRTDGCQDTQEVRAARERAHGSRGEGHGDAFWQVRDAGCENPDGDVLGTYVRAARAAGLRVGVYLSPSDGAELPHAWHEQEYIPAIRAKPPSQRSTAERATLEDAPRPPAGLGRFGNGSAPSQRTIPTLVEGDDRARDVTRGRLPRFSVRVNDYDAYYLNQLYELFTQYGPIDELWLDGANPWGNAGIEQRYDFTTWFDIVERLSPRTLVFAGPQGTRWVGNEAGVARTTEWSVVPATADPSTAHNEGLIPGGAQSPDVGSRLLLADPRVRFIQWFPAEADTSNRPGWFYHPDEAPKPPGQLEAIYRNSVGRNAVLLLNVPPAPDGRIAPADVDSLTAFGDAVRAKYATNLLAPTGRIERDLGDDELRTAWSPPRGATAGTVELRLPGPRTFDQIRLGEDITRGQQVEQFAVDRRDGTGWARIATGTTIGYSRILALGQPVTTDRIRVHIVQARATPRLTFVGLYAPGEAPDNAALGKPATQKSVGNGGVPERAVDGNTDGTWGAGSVTHTAEDGSPEPWWQVDLGADVPIREIAVWNRTDCCGERLSDYYVLVSDQPFAGDSLAAVLAQPGVTAFHQPGTAGSPTRIPMDLSGRHVRVQLTGNAPLSLAEVEVRLKN
jgi:alpha-L-fucosidase